ncbi:MAG TPA: peptidoglycan DD-metalloendopeptidase family protein [Solirubrobacterales bacterium]|nr:peptidoglycan DD-metalloendopeptidase family protein [Solirubrobacterales bacterium]
MDRTAKPAAQGNRGRRAGFALTAGLVAIVVAGATALAQDLESDLDSKQAQLDQAESKRGVLSTEIQRYTSEIVQLEGEVATLRNREALVQEELEQKQAELDREREHLQVLRERLRQSIDVLEERLVAIYKSDTPDVVTVVLESDGFEDVLDRYEYLNRIETEDSDLIARVRELRNETKATVERIRAARDEIAAKKRELTRTRVELEAREAALGDARGSRKDTLAEIDSNIKRLEGDIGDLEGQIQQQLQASASPTLPAGPVRGGSGDMIWPVDGPVTSPFGMRWGRLHAGIDISVPSGTPIRAAKSGSIAMAAPTGGYGNYTCINHGGGQSTCYAHQSSFAVTSGSVGQGEVIGYVGCTGSCFGDHLHFEVRINGQPTDPLGYL